MMKRNAGFILLLILIVYFSGCENSSKMGKVVYYEDSFHQQVGDLVLELTPPDVWTEVVHTVEIGYIMLDHEKLTATLCPEVTSEKINLRDEDDEIPDYYMERLLGSDGALWWFWEGSPTAATKSQYEFCKEDSYFDLSYEFDRGAKDEIKEEALELARDFLSSVGIENVELYSFDQSENIVYMHFGYADLNGIPFFDTASVEEGTPFGASSWFNVAVADGAIPVRAEITSPYQVLSTGASEKIHTPEDAAELLVEWYVENAYGESFSFNEMGLYWAIAPDSVCLGEEMDTAIFRPYWIFTGSHETHHEIVGVDAISGAVVSKARC